MIAPRAMYKRASRQHVSRLHDDAAFMNAAPVADLCLRHSTKFIPRRAPHCGGPRWATWRVSAMGNYARGAMVTMVDFGGSDLQGRPTGVTLRFSKLAPRKQWPLTTARAFNNRSRTQA